HPHAGAAPQAGGGGAHRRRPGRQADPRRPLRRIVPTRAAGVGRAARPRARLVVGGADAPAGLQRGYYVQPTIFADVRPDMTIAQEEIFGPVLSIIPYDTEEEAVRIANDTVYGLAGAVWSGDPARAERVARRLRTGQVDVNGGRFNPMAPFGGFKQSGLGRELGRYGLEEF